MRLTVDVLHKQITVVTPSPGVGVPDKTESYPLVPMPAVETGIVRIGWDDDEMHHVAGEDGAEGVTTRGKGIIVRSGANPGEVHSEVFTDKELMAPFLRALDDARTRAAAEAASAKATAAGQTAAPFPAPPGFTR